jgi:hypothetical protein
MLEVIADQWPDGKITNVFWAIFPTQEAGMPGLIHATAASGWSLSGSILTFAMPMLLFIAAATVLYLLFTRPHPVPGHRLLARVQAAQPDASTARSMAAAAGMTTESGAGAAAHLHEPAAGVGLTDESPAGHDVRDASAQGAGPEAAE